MYFSVSSSITLYTHIFNLVIIGYIIPNTFENTPRVLGKPNYPENQLETRNPKSRISTFSPLPSATMLPRALVIARQQHTRTAAILPPHVHTHPFPLVHLQLKRRLLHVYTQGEGFLGCLGHGDFSKQQVCKRVDGVAQADVRTVSAGWTHSAATCSTGQLVVWGRPYDFKGSMRLNNLNKIVPFFVRAINAFSNPGEVLPHPVIVPVRTSAQIQERPWDASKPLRAALPQPPVNTTQRGNHASSLNGGDASSTSIPVEHTAPSNANAACAVPSVTTDENFDTSNGESYHDGMDGLAGPKAVSVSCSAALTVVLTERGRVYCMGQNRWGQCGQGKDAPIHVFEPMVVKGIALSKEKVVKVAVGFQHCLVLCDSGKVFGWGKGERGQLGTGDDHSENLAVPGKEMENVPKMVVFGIFCTRSQHACRVMSRV